MRRPTTHARPVRILLTGFGPFPDMPDNPSARIVSRLSADRTLARRPGLRLVSRVLPTAWAALPALADFVRLTRPDVVVMVGVHGRANEIRIEVSGWNETVPLPDARGACPNEVRLDRAGPGVRHPAAAFAGRVAGSARETGAPVRPSRDAGRYLCNAGLFTALGVRVPGQPCHARVFVHIPPPRTAVGVTEAAIANCLRAILLSAAR